MNVNTLAPAHCFGCIRLHKSIEEVEEIQELENIIASIYDDSGKIFGHHEAESLNNMRLRMSYTNIGNETSHISHSLGLACE